MNAQQVTVLDDTYAFWHAKLAGVDPEPLIDRTKLPLGFWRLRDNRPLAVWLDGGGERVALRGFAPAKLMSPGEMERVAEMGGFGVAVPEAAYRAAFDAGRWEDDPPALPGIGHNSATDDPLDAIRQELAGEAETAAEFLREPVTTRADADKCATWARRVGLLQKRADEAFETEKAEPLAACRAVDDRWREVRAAAKELTKALKKHVEPYLIALKAERAKHTAEPAPINAGRPHMKVGLRERSRAVITDYDACFAALKDRPEMHAFVQACADEAVSAGERLAGVEAQTYEVAA